MSTDFIKSLCELTTEKLKAVSNEIRNEIWNREHVERRGKHQKLIGNCYRYRNSYGGDSDGWWLYIRITHIDAKGQLHGVQFQDDNQGKMSHEVGYISESCLGDLISRNEWNKAFSAFRQKMHARSIREGST